MAAKSPETIEAAILSLLDERNGRSICPSEVARKLAPEDWRTLMPSVRDAAARLAGRKKLIATQKGREVDVLSAHGPIRLNKPG
jgi:hypothetical protein